jgi:hypothetical protein
MSESKNIPESVLKKRRTLETIKAERTARLAAESKVCF